MGLVRRSEAPDVGKITDFRYVIACDFGQVSDYTAIAVTRRRLVPVGEPYAAPVTYHHTGLKSRRGLEHRQDVQAHYDLIRLDRPPLRTSYTNIARGIVKLLREFYAAHTGSDGYRGGERVYVGLAIDEGGVGVAVKDVLVSEWQKSIIRGEPHVNFLPVTMHGGTSVTRDGNFVHAPKRDVVGAGIVAYQNGRLHVGKLRFREVLEDELSNYRLKQNIATAHVAFEPLREGQHDDLLFATCLGVWAWEFIYRPKRFVRL
jgi:hypothetical protein